LAGQAGGQQARVAPVGVAPALPFHDIPLPPMMRQKPKPALMNALKAYAEWRNYHPEVGNWNMEIAPWWSNATDVV
jgi:hypothetical protein